MINKRLAAGLLCLLAAVSLSGCGSSGSIDDYLQNNQVQLEPSHTDAPAQPTAPTTGSSVSAGDVSASDATTTTTTTTTSATTTATTAAPQVTVLPESIIGSWSVVSVYQEAIASDISVEEALRRERASGISFGSASFDRSGESISNARFVVDTNADYSDMERMGISAKALMGPYGSDAGITSVEISTEDGMLCTTVFIINDTTLIAFGSGMNVFTYEQMAAVG